MNSEQRTANNLKKQKIKIQGKNWERCLVKTHFITKDDNLENIIEKYALREAKKSDIVALCQKIVSITHKKIIYRKDIKLGFWAKFLSKFVKKTPYGFSVGNPLKMQVAINLAGLPRILFASICAIFGKIVGIKGIFYKIAGHQINQIDGFYGEAFPQYNDMAILGLDRKFSNNLCDKLKEKYNLSFAIVDINDIGGNILGTSADIKEKTKLILELLKDNPAGQSNQQTPIIILKKC
jgi:F420-0:gamma-glutamyl ligase-like protein